MDFAFFGSEVGVVVDGRGGGVGADAGAGAVDEGGSTLIWPQRLRGHRRLHF